MDGERPDSAGDYGLGDPEQHSMQEGANSIQNIDQQDADKQPYDYDDTFVSQDEPDPDADSSLEPTSDAIDYAGDEYYEEELDGNDGLGPFLSEAEVGGWDHEKTSAYLQQIGVDPRHCETLEKQVVTGNVLLGMSQDSVLTEHLKDGPRGRRLKTSRKIQQFQQDLREGGALREPPLLVLEHAGNNAEIADSDPLKSRSFKHPQTWKHEMTERLRIDETSDESLEDLLEDLLDSGKVHQQDDDEDVLSTRQQADFRFRLNKDEVGGVERATSSMCADLFDKFNAHRRLKKYRPR
jgi:SAM domain (Sterile alpha motif)